MSSLEAIYPLRGGDVLEELVDQTRARFSKLELVAGTDVDEAASEVVTSKPVYVIMPTELRYWGCPKREDWLVDPNLDLGGGR